MPAAKLEGIARTNLDSPNPTPPQLERRKKSIAIVKEMNLPWMDQLPVVEDETSFTPRTKEEVAERCIATTITAVKGELHDSKVVGDLVAKFSAESFFSPQERKFINDPKPEQKELADYSWRYESSHVFLWALGHLPRLNPPHQAADVKKVGEILMGSGRELATKATLRSSSEILDQADLYYRLHWAVIELRLKGKKSDRADEEIIFERHRALNWLIRYMNQAWDDVTTDT